MSTLNISDMPLDPEIKSLAALSLRNAFWHDFSGLVNTYLQAAEGLDADDTVDGPSMICTSHWRPRYLT